ncbi:MAG: transposase [Pedobacter sp.]|nr:transposase [Pedobacter sp.]
MSYNDLRLGRYSQRQQVYHITTVTRGRQPVFAEWRKGRIVVQNLMTLAKEGKADTLCYVVMPDHVHWLMELKQGNLADAMQLLKGRCAHHLAGQIWQPGFHDHALRHEEDMAELARYIVANPLRAGLVKRLGDYPLWDAIWL